MNPVYAIHDTSALFSPALLFYKPLIERNIALAVKMAGNPDRLRPHVKTHKTREIVRLELAAGITKHKCATLAECEMVASCGAADVMLAYTLVGPNCDRMVRLMKAYPGCRFSALADHPQATRRLSETMAAASLTLDVVLDLDVGMHRTGIAPGPEAVALYELIDRLPGLRPDGFHVYDGHNNQESYAEREASVTKLVGPVLELRALLEKQGLPVPRVVAGGTPTFPVFARQNWPGLECSPGTLVLHDHGYGSKYGEMSGITPAALLFTRVISRPTPRRITLDLGYKAVASDPPAGKRCILLNVPDYEAVLQSEEHFAVETPAGERFQPGDAVYAMPTHVCPTCAMHRFAHVVDDGKIVDRWEIVARDRVLSI